MTDIDRADPTRLSLHDELALLMASVQEIARRLDVELPRRPGAEGLPVT
jgi:hypothetical protein